jgi:hypothetical protein
LAFFDGWKRLGIFVLVINLKQMGELNWTKEEKARLDEGRMEIKLRLHKHDLPFQFFDKDICSKGELCHEYADGRIEVWDFSGKSAPHMLRTVTQHA